MVVSSGYFGCCVVALTGSREEKSDGSPSGRDSVTWRTRVPGGMTELLGFH
jgi:hypothetical protein